MDAAEAAGLVARAAVEMTGALTKRSAGAIRQQRWRDRNKASQGVTQEDGEGVTKRNESVMRNADCEASQSVSNRNEASQRNGTSLSKEEKKEEIEVKKRERAEKRASQLPTDWRPGEKQWQDAVVTLGSEDRAERELRKFTNHALAKGRTAKNWNAAWNNWVDRALEWENGNGNSNSRADTATGRATAREAQHVAQMGGAALRYLQESKAARQVGDLAGGAGTAEIFDFGPRAENAR